MNDRFRTRRGAVVLAGAVSAFAALPVTADSQIPGSNVLKGVPAVPNVLERAGNQLDAVKRRALSPRRSAPAGTQPTAPQQSTPAAPSARPAPRIAAASHSAVQRHVTAAGTANHAGAAASTGRSAAKAATAPARASAAAAPARAAARPTVVSPGSNVQNDPSLPFTGSRPLDVLALGLVALAIGLVARYTLRGRRPRQDSNLRPAA